MILILTAGPNATAGLAAALAVGAWVPLKVLHRDYRGEEGKASVGKACCTGSKIKEPK